MHVAGFGDGKLAQQQVFGVVYARRPKLNAVFDFTATVVDFLQTAGADGGTAVVIVTLDGSQAGDAAQL